MNPPIQIPLDSEQSMILTAAGRQFSASLRQTKRGGVWMLFAKPTLRAKHAPVVIRRCTTTIQSGGFLANFVRTLNPGGRTVSFRITDTIILGPKGSEQTYDPPLSLIDAALEEAQMQVDEIRKRGTFLHYTRRGVPLIFRLRPQSIPQSIHD
jgi:hypothetical protein